MSRVMKFRVWNIKTNSWDSPAILEVFDMSGVLRPLYDPVSEFVIQQSIDILDIKGFEIFEGDLVNVTLQSMGAIAVSKNETPDVRLGYVFYHQESCGFRVQLKSCQYSILGGNNLEIIGNIFENKDLLKN